jgi:fimbrial chaperone protein
VGDPALAMSKHYYVTVAQLPVQQPAGQAGVQVLYNFQVLASVGPQGLKPALRIVSAGIGRNTDGKPAPVVTVANESATYGYLSRGQLRVVQKDESGREVLRQTFSGAEIQQALGVGLMASGQQRKITLPIVLPTERGSIVAQFIPGK